MQAYLAQSLRGSGDAAGEDLLEEILAGAVACDTAVDDAAEQGRATQAVGTVDAARELAAGVEAFEGDALAVEDLGFVVDFDAAHCEVEDRLHDGDVEGVADVEGEVVEEFLAEGVFLLAVRDGVVVGEGLLQRVFGAADGFCEVLTGHFLHKSAPGVVPRVEIEDVGGFGVENESDGPFSCFLLLPHLPGYIVAVTELVGEPLAGAIQEETALTAQCLVVLARLKKKSWDSCD